MSRRLKNGVLEAICKYAEDTEIPPMFAVWSGIATVSAVLGRDCFVDWGYYTIFPNLYIVLLGASALTKKSSAIRMARRFLSKVRPAINIVGQKMTPEGLIGTLSGMLGKDGDTKVIPSAVGIAIAAELATLVDKNSFKSGLIGVLTDLYDCEDFAYVTRSRGEELVKNPCLSILGGSTLNWARECIPAVSVMGGFTARIVFVYKEDNPRMVPRPFLTDENKKRAEDIEHDLNEIAKMRGPFAFSDDAARMYDEEYVNFRQHSKLLEEETLHGYVGRRHDILTKVAMVVSAANRDDKLITATDLGIAISVLKDAEDAMPLIIQRITAKEVGDIFEEIIQFIARRKVVVRSELVRRFKRKMTADELTIMMKTLDEEGIVRTEVDGSTIRYVFTGGK